MIIFLDIDGVMVPAKSWKCPELLADEFPAFSDKATRALQNLISDDTIIILTTSHKSNYELSEWKEIFSRRGITVKRIQRLDANYSNLGRAAEILAWFNVNQVHEDFIIIDDDKSLNALPSYLKENLILTSPMVGLTEEHVAVAKSILHQSLQTA